MGEQVAAGFPWGISSVGRAPALQAGGHEFESRILRHQGFGFCQNPFVIRTHMHIRSGPNMCTIVHIHCFCSGVAWHIFRDDRIPTIFVPQQRIKTRKCDYVAHPNAT